MSPDGATLYVINAGVGTIDLIDVATRNQTGDRPNSLFAYTRELRGWDADRIPAYLGIDFFLRGDTVVPGPFGALNSPRTFGGLGAGSTFNPTFLRVSNAGSGLCLKCHTK